MATIQASGLGCGSGIIAGLYGAKDVGAERVLFEALQKQETLYHQAKASLHSDLAGYSILLFGDGVYNKKSNGEALADLIEKEKLGKVKASDPVPNRAHSGNNDYQIWIWQVDAKAVATWFLEEKKKRGLEKERARDAFGRFV